MMADASRTVIVTRPAEQALETRDLLRARGVRAEELPLIGIAPADDPEPLRRAAAQLSRWALIVFVSPNAVARFFADGRPPCWPPGLRAAVTGPGSARALHAAGLEASAVVAPAPSSPRFDSEALWERLRSDDWRERRVLIVRGDGGRDWLAETLRAHGAEVEFVQAYARCMPRLDEAALDLLRRSLAEPSGFVWWFGSAEAIDRLEVLAPDASWSASSTFASHPRIAERARSAGFGSVECIGSSLDDVVRIALGSTPDGQDPVDRMD